MPRKKIPMSERTHGLATTYKAGCRCADCTSAASTYAKERYEARKAGDVRSPGGQRKHGAHSTWRAGCRCGKCCAANDEYNAKRRGDEKPAKPDVEVMREIRMPVSCPNCGAEVVQQTPASRTGSGMRVTVMLRCSKNGCNRQWQFIGTLMSLSGSEYLGAA
jgi:hypothetical protein